MVQVNVFIKANELLPINHQPVRRRAGVSNRDRLAASKIQEMLVVAKIFCANRFVVERCSEHESVHNRPIRLRRQRTHRGI